MNTFKMPECSHTMKDGEARTVVAKAGIPECIFCREARKDAEIAELRARCEAMRVALVEIRDRRGIHCQGECNVSFAMEEIADSALRRTARAALSAASGGKETGR